MRTSLANSTHCACACGMQIFSTNCLEILQWRRNSFGLVEMDFGWSVSNQPKAVDCFHGHVRNCLKNYIFTALAETYLWTDMGCSLPSASCICIFYELLQSQARDSVHISAIFPRRINAKKAVINAESQF